MESRKAPKAPVLPWILASVPSSMSVITKAVHTTVPTKRWPVGNRLRAPTVIPIVPVTVSMLGVIGVCASARLTGVSSWARPGLSTFSMSV